MTLVRAVPPREVFYKILAVTDTILQKAENAPHMGTGFQGPAGKRVVGSVSQKLTWGPGGNRDVFICTREGNLEALGSRSPLTCL